MPAHVIILGCGRSGTSIFGELFDHLPDYTYFSEPPFALMKELDYSRPVAVKVPRESEGYVPSPGLSFPLVELLAVVPQPRVLFWQVRHPLDAVCSLKVGISKAWGHHPKPHDWEQWLDRPLPERCAHHWNYLNTIGYEQVADLAQIMFFEDMILDPDAFAVRVGEKTGIDVEARQGTLSEWAERVQNTNNEKFVEARTSRPYSTDDHKTRVGRWKENLNQAEIEMVLPIVQDTAAKFGYQL